ncbi:type IX secretion/gliding motility protein PorT/SprT [Wenyingzhuangia sp. IMCC45574]
MVRVVIFFFFLVSTVSYSQREKISRLQHFDRSKVRYGFYLGINHSGYRTSQNSKSTITGGSGFQLGVLADLNLNNNISIIAEPGVMSTRATLEFSDGESLNLNNTYFRVPISLKLTTDRINNFRTFATGGLAFNYNFSADENLNIDKEDYAFSLAKNTITAEISVGFNFYFPFFKFSPSIRGIYGINNEFEGIGSIAKSSGPALLNQRAIFLNLTFQ